MSKNNLFLKNKLGTLLVVGLILVSNSPVLALAADDVSLPENQTPAVEVVETTISETVEVTEEVVIEEAVEVEVEITEEVVSEVTDEVTEVVETATSTESSVVEVATSTDVAVLEVTPEIVVAAKAMTMAAETTTTSTDNSFAISDEFGSTSATTSNPTNPGNSNSGESNFTTNPNNGCTSNCNGSNNQSDEGNFTTNPGNGCTSNCGATSVVSVEGNFKTLATGGCTSNCNPHNDEVVSNESNFTTLPNGGCTGSCGCTTCGTNPVVSTESNFTTLSDSGCTSNCGCTSGCGCTSCGTNPGVSGEGSFYTLSNGGGCTSNCNPDDGDEVVSAENSFTTSSNGGGCGSSCGGDDDDDNNGGGGSGGGRRNRDRDLPAACEVYLKKFIRLGYANDPYEVIKLEVFLNAFEGFDLPVNGIYEQRDFEAVSIFQKRYLGAVLNPWGITDSTGYVYITTTLTINQIYCRHTVGNDLDLRSVYPVYNPATGEVEGFTSTSTSSSTPSIQDIPNFFEAAAVGMLDFIKDWWCLLAIIILILIIAYLLDERERLAKRLEEAKRLNLDQGAGVTEIIIPSHFEETDVEGTFIPEEEVSEDQKPLL